MKRYVTFIETRVFSKRIAGLMNDEEYSEFQAELAHNPEKGPVIQGTGGLRKVRWGLKGKGKSGGLRVIYLYMRARSHVHLAFAFAKDQSDDLTSDQKKQLKSIVDAIKREYTE